MNGDRGVEMDTWLEGFATAMHAHSTQGEVLQEAAQRVL